MKSLVVASGAILGRCWGLRRRGRPQRHATGALLRGDPDLWGSTYGPGKNLHAVRGLRSRHGRAVCSVACLAWVRWIAGSAETVPATKAKGELACWGKLLGCSLVGGRAGITVRTKWPSSSATGDDARRSRGNPVSGDAGADRGGKPAGPKPQRLPASPPPEEGLRRRPARRRLSRYRGQGHRALKMGLLSVLASVTVLMVTQRPLPGVWGILFSVGVIAIVLAVGIVFDIVGVSVTAASPQPFHARAAHSEAGAVQSIRLLRHADKVANFCLDFVGDLAGTLTGAMATATVYRLTDSSNAVLFGSLAVGVVAGVNVGVKSIAKSVALGNATDVVRHAGEVLSWTERLGVPPLLATRPNSDHRKPMQPTKRKRALTGSEMRPKGKGSQHGRSGPH